MRKVKFRLNMLPEQRDLVMRAACLSGKTLSEFIIEAVYEQANSVLQNQPSKYLSDEQFELINQSLDQFMPGNQGMRRLMSIKAPWLT